MWTKVTLTCPLVVAGLVCLNRCLLNLHCHIFFIFSFVFLRSAACYVSSREAFFLPPPCSSFYFASLVAVVTQHREVKNSGCRRERSSDVSLRKRELQTMTAAPPSTDHKRRAQKLNSQRRRRRESSNTGRRTVGR